MQSCVERYLSINSPCGDQLPTGICDITEVTGFTWNRAADIAEGNFKESTAYQIAVSIRRRSATVVMADLMQAMYEKGWATNLTAGQHRSGDFKANTPAGSALKRGIQITAAAKCGYTGMKLKSVFIKGTTDVTTTVNIMVDNEVSQYPVTLIAHQIYDMQNLVDAAGKNLFAVNGAVITIWIEDVNFKPYEVTPNCARCHAQVVICANSKGWVKNGTSVSENPNLAYGIIAEVSCECDYDRILCALPNDEFKAQLLKYQMSILFARKALETDRFNYFTIYGREELLQYIAIAQNGYRTRIDLYIKALRTYFKTNKFCGCIECFGSQQLPLV